MLKYKQYRSEIMGGLLCLTLGLLSGFFVQGGDSVWYASLNKPSFNPPNWIFGPTWFVLYIMMGVALGKIWNNRERNTWPLVIFIVQFIFNLLWSPLFFYFHRIDLALYDLGLLWLSLVLLMVLVWNRRTIFLLLLPYLLWSSFAFILNLAIWNLANFGVES